MTSAPHQKPVPAAGPAPAAAGASLKEAILADPDAGARRLVAECGPALFALAVRLAPDAGDAEELVFRTLARAVERIGQFEDGTNLRAWLRAILVNERRKDLRRATPLADPDLELADTAPSPAERAAARSDAEALAAALVRLPAAFRDVVVLHYFEDLPPAEISALLDLPLGTVKWRLHQSRERLRAALAPALATGAGSIPGRTD